MPASLEICVEDMDGLAACIRAGVDRVELCSALALGGLTPSAGFMQQAAGCGLPVYALIRPRPGGFCYDEDEITAICADISIARSAGLAGVVLGAALPDGRLNLPALSRMSAAAKGMGRSLHRVVDLVPDPMVAIDQAVALGFERILTSGQAASAPDGADCLAAMQAHAAGRIEIMAGAGLTADNILPLARRTGIRAFHASCSRPVPQDARLRDFGFAPATARQTETATIQAMQQALAQLG